MDQNNRSLQVAGVAIVIVLAVFASIILPSVLEKVPRVSLADISGEGTQSSFEQTYLKVDITPQNVQEVIATLARPESYYRTLSVTNYAGSGNQIISNTEDLEVWLVPGCLETVVKSDDGRSQHRIVSGDKMYLWYSGNKTWVERAAAGKSMDLAQHIPTYEDVLLVPEESITGAGFEQKNGRPCIWVQAVNEWLGTTDTYWVDVESGLLNACRTQQADVIVYEMNETVRNIPLTEAHSFELPDGTVLQKVTEPE